MPTESVGAPSLLMVDDDEAISETLAPVLRRAGFAVTVVTDGSAALAAVERLDPDVIVLDVLMPGLDGREVLRRLRADGRWNPVLLLTQVSSTTERVTALDDGADDYLDKPFDPLELIARIRAVLRRSRRDRPPLSASTTLRAGALRVDRRAHRAWLAGRELVITPKAMILLDYLLTHPGELLGRDRLLAQLWGFDHPTGTRAVDHRIAELRKVLGDDAGAPRWIATVPGLGYRFVADVESGR